MFSNIASGTSVNFFSFILIKFFFCKIASRFYVEIFSVIHINISVTFLVKLLLLLFIFILM